MKQKIAIKYCNGLILPEDGQDEEKGISLAFIAEMMQYGFMPDAELTDALGKIAEEDVASLYLEVIPVLKELVGANVVHKPLYPNFPKQVMEADEAELFLNAQLHYLSEGQWIPNFAVNNRPVSFENVKFKTLGVISETELNGVFTQILQSADSISGYSKEVVEWFVDSGRSLILPEKIPFKENVCLLAGIFLERNMWNTNLVKDTTDILRIATHLSGGDISLAENTKFESFPRKIRKELTRSLERVIKEEDLVAHKNKWIKLMHSLHVGDYSKKVYRIAKKLRENEKINTFNGNVEKAIETGNMHTVVGLLQQRPGVFARTLARLLSTIGMPPGDQALIVNGFAEVVDKVPARNLTQLWGSLRTRVGHVDKRVVFPKGSVSQAYVLRNKLARLPDIVIYDLVNIIRASLATRFSEREPLGKVYIDPALDQCPLPTGMRSASEGLREVARGTRMPIGDKDALRFFIYWKGQDLDLSASFHDEDFGLIEYVSYTNLRSQKYKAAHSGDITDAPKGASEFIDIDIASALKYGARYVAMNVYVYYGPTFAEHEECFAGWMTRDDVASNEIFEPKTVEQRIDLRSNSEGAIPVMFDLKERKAIWLDINVSGNSFDTRTYGTSGNNIENNRASTEELVEAFVSLDNKISLADLFTIHAMARGSITNNKDEADTIFAMDEGVTPYDVTTINAEYL
jgi:hypothetical protein